MKHFPLYFYLLVDFFYINQYYYDYEVLYVLKAKTFFFKQLETFVMKCKHPAAALWNES